MNSKSLIRIAIAVLVLAIACAAGWWAYQGKQKRVLQQDVLALVKDSTARLREAMGLLPAGVDARAKLEPGFVAVKASVEKLKASNVALNPPLVSAADAYITDVQALLRRLLDMAAGREAVRADVAAINEHLKGAGGRSPEWFNRAVALKQRLDKSFFDYRLAAGGVDKSLRSLMDSRKALEAQVPADLVIELKELHAARDSLLGANAQVEQQFEASSRVAGR
jgi:hypothetical protein